MRRNLSVVLGLAALLAASAPAGQASPAQASAAPVMRPTIFGLPMLDFKLTAIQGGEYGPSLLKGKNVLIVFPRGKVDDHWCQICHYQYIDLADLEAKSGIRKAHDLEIVFVLPYGEAEVRHWAGLFPSQMAVIDGWKNPPAEQAEKRKRFTELARRFFPKTVDYGGKPAPLPFPILYDTDASVSKGLGLFTSNWDQSAVDQNIPTVVLLNKAGEVVFKYTSQVTWDRPDAAYLVKMMDTLLR